jgi:hypothetical protein
LRATGKVPEEFSPIPAPESIIHIWYWFQQLSRTRSSNGFGQDPISYNEINAWSQLTGVDPEPIEVQAIMVIDSVFMSMQAKAIEKRSKKRG